MHIQALWLTCLADKWEDSSQNQIWLVKFLDSASKHQQLNFNCNHFRSISFSGKILSQVILMTANFSPIYLPKVCCLSQPYILINNLILIYNPLLSFSNALVGCSQARGTYFIADSHWRLLDLWGFWLCWFLLSPHCHYQTKGQAYRPRQPQA